MTDKTMAEVLSELDAHRPDHREYEGGWWELACAGCDFAKGQRLSHLDWAPYRAHRAEVFAAALSVAGLGPVQEVSERVGKRYAKLHQMLRDELQAQAWDEGYTTGNAHNGRRDANPYRTEASLAGGKRTHGTRTGGKRSTFKGGDMRYDRL